jgi:hypothetical protein
MQPRILLAGLTGAGMIATTLMQAATALADSSGASGADAFSIDSTIFNPYYISSSGAEIQGYAPVAQIDIASPLWQLGKSLGQHFDVHSASGTSVGSIESGETTVANLLGMSDSGFTVTTATAASGDTGAQAAELPAVGTVYDVFHLGHGVANVYTATPGADGTVTDTLMTPLGDINLSPLVSGIDAAEPLQPADAFTALAGHTSAGNSDAFAIGTLTFDPFTVTSSGTEVPGFTPVYQLIGAPPVLNVGDVGVGSYYFGALPLVTQSFDVYNGTSASAVDIGTISSNEYVTVFLGMTSVGFLVTGSTAASADTGAQAAELPAVGTVYDVFNLGHGIENVYTATPGADGTVTDTLMTPLGNIDLSALFSGIDAATLDPGAAFDVGSATASTIDPASFLAL